jgi:hypothetical protein
MTKERASVFGTDDARDLSGFGPKSDRSRTRCPPSFALPHRAKLARLREVDERRFAPPEHRPRWRRLVGRGIRIRARSRDGRGSSARRRLCRATCNRQLTGQKIFPVVWSSHTVWWLPRFGSILSLGIIYSASTATPDQLCTWRFKSATSPSLAFQPAMPPTKRATHNNMALFMIRRPLFAVPALKSRRRNTRRRPHRETISSGRDQALPLSHRSPPAFPRVQRHPA